MQKTLYLEKLRMKQAEVSDEAMQSTDGENKTGQTHNNVTKHMRSSSHRMFRVPGALGGNASAEPAPAAASSSSSSSRFSSSPGARIFLTERKDQFVLR